jgi:hypothetical protein
MIRLSTVALATLLVASASSAMAQSRIEVGVLECRGSTTSFIIGSVTELRCVFRSGGLAEPYVATVRRVGLDIGINQDTAIAWGVFAPTNRLGPGDLAGNYVGASASATLGVGVGANALIGGSNRTVALQPLSVTGQTGINLAGGVASLELRSTN